MVHSAAIVKLYDYFKSHVSLLRARSLHNEKTDDEEDLLQEMEMEDGEVYGLRQARQLDHSQIQVRRHFDRTCA